MTITRRAAALAKICMVVVAVVVVVVVVVNRCVQISSLQIYELNARLAAFMQINLLIFPSFYPN